MGRRKGSNPDDDDEDYVDETETITSRASTTKRRQRKPRDESPLAKQFGSSAVDDNAQIKDGSNIARGTWRWSRADIVWIIATATLLSWYSIFELKLLFGLKYWGISSLEALGFNVLPWFGTERAECGLNWTNEQIAPVFLGRFGACSRRIPSLLHSPGSNGSGSALLFSELIGPALDRGLCEIDTTSVTSCALAFSCQDLAIIHPEVKTTLYEGKRQSTRAVVFLSRCPSFLSDAEASPSITVQPNETLLIVGATSPVRCRILNPQNRLRFSGDLIKPGSMLRLSRDNSGTCTSASPPSVTQSQVGWAIALGLSPIGRISRGEFGQHFVELVLSNQLKNPSNRPRLEMDLQSSKLYEGDSTSRAASECFKLAMQRKFDLDDVIAFVDGKLTAVIQSLRDMDWFSLGLEQRDELVSEELRSRILATLKRVILVNEQQMNNQVPTAKACVVHAAFGFLSGVTTRGPSSMDWWARLVDQSLRDTRGKFIAAHSEDMFARQKERDAKKSGLFGRMWRYVSRSSRDVVWQAWCDVIKTPSGLHEDEFVIRLLDRLCD